MGFPGYWFSAFQTLEDVLWLPKGTTQDLLVETLALRVPWFREGFFSGDAVGFGKAGVL